MKTVLAKWELWCRCPGCGDRIELVEWFDYSDNGNADDLFAEATSKHPVEFVTECPTCEAEFAFSMQR